MKYSVIYAVLVVVVGFCTPAWAEDPEHVVRLLQSNDCPNCDLRGTDLTGLNLRGANLRGADLRGANLSVVNLTKANLSGANLSQASLVFTDLTDAVLDEANLAGALFQGGDKLGPAQSFPRAILPYGREAYTPE